MASNRIRPPPYIMRGSNAAVTKESICSDEATAWTHPESGLTPYQTENYSSGSYLSKPVERSRETKQAPPVSTFQKQEGLGLQIRLPCFYTFKHSGQNKDEPGKPGDINIAEGCIGLSCYRYVMDGAASHSLHSMAQAKTVESLESCTGTSFTYN